MIGFIERGMAWIEGLSRMRRFVLCVAVVLSLGSVDYASGYEISFSVFYLFPVILASWYLGRLALVTIAALSALTWFVSDMAAGHQYSHSAIPVWNSSVRLAVFLIIGYLVAGNKRLLERERSMSMTDALTGAANGRAFRGAARLELHRSTRNKHELTIAYIDIDNFKKVNDTFGHGTGDALLREVATRITEELRNVDTVARIGGDEFAIMLPEAGLESAESILVRLRQALLEDAAIAAYPVSFSIGAVTCHADCGKGPCDVERLISEADRVMYEVKTTGKDNLKIRRCEGL